MPLAINTDNEIDPQSSLLTIGRKPLSIALASMVATCLLVTSGCIALSIPSKRFHDPQDHGGLFGDFRRGGAPPIPGHAVDGSHFMSDSGHPTQCAENCGLGACGNGMSYDDFDEDAEFGPGGHHQKTPEVPWPRYHPVPTRPVFSNNAPLPNR